METNIQTKTRLEIMKSFLEKGKTLEIGIINHRITKGISLDCEKDLNPDILCDLNHENIPIPNNSFNVVVAGELIEHMINPYKTVREFYRILKIGGILIISTPNTCSLVNRIKMLFGIMPLYSAIPVDEVTSQRHVVNFNIEILKEVLFDAGFQIEEIKSNGLITRSKLITKFIPPSMGETLIVKARRL